jgi:hypothetical protein
MSMGRPAAALVVLPEAIRARLGGSENGRIGSAPSGPTPWGGRAAVPSRQSAVNEETQLPKGQSHPPSNIALEQTAGAPARPAAAHRER